MGDDTGEPTTVHPHQKVVIDDGVIIVDDVNLVATVQRLARDVHRVNHELYDQEDPQTGKVNPGAFTKLDRVNRALFGERNADTLEWKSGIFDMIKTDRLVMRFVGGLLVARALGIPTDEVVKAIMRAIVTAASAVGTH